MQPRLLKEIEEEATNLLSGLIRINTTNPPGNETDAAKYLAGHLGREGFNCEIFEPAHGRGNVITRMKGTGEKPSLLLLSHLDVVAADAEEWSLDPFSGIVKDGFVWGRGALDMKGMTAIEVMTMELKKKRCETQRRCYIGCDGRRRAGQLSWSSLPFAQLSTENIRRLRSERRRRVGNSDPQQKRVHGANG
jgi:acetylornithine deacetylase/succinyl-diaminopimelate desuccinylase-like protein